MGSDCNGNNVADLEDIAEGTSQDANENGMPDECETNSDGDQMVDARDVCPLTSCPQCFFDERGRPLGNLNGDCEVNLSDFSTFSVDFGTK